VAFLPGQSFLCADHALNWQDFPQYIAGQSRHFLSAGFLQFSQGLAGMKAENTLLLSST
jgi:hypothetical protein